MTKEEPLPTREIFEEWLGDMHPKLAGFGAFLAGDFPDNFSKESLVYLETVLLDAFPDRDAIFKQEVRDFLDRCVRYIGETTIRSFGGSWEYSTDPSDMFTGVPFVRPDDGVGIPIAPLYEITTLVDRHTNSELSSLCDVLEDRRRTRHDGPSRKPSDTEPAFYAKLNHTEREFLDNWRSTMDAKLADWRKTYLPSDFPFNFTRDSLVALGGVVLDRFSTRDEVEQSKNADFTRRSRPILR